jgi:hypothetical protein
MISRPLCSTIPPQPTTLKYCSELLEEPETSVKYDSDIPDLIEDDDTDSDDDSCHVKVQTNSLSRDASSKCTCFYVQAYAYSSKGGCLLQCILSVKVS